MVAAITHRQTVAPVSLPPLRRAVARALAAVGRAGGTVEVELVDDREIRRMNTRYRGIRRRTDVLAFPLELREAESPLVGQIVISVDTARRQARRLRVPLPIEMELLVIHGVLHLIGYDDRDPLEAELMHRRERAILSAGHRRLPERLWTGLLHR